ncbi:hypothetical protein QYE76_000500 [Lolium multiflorum]|uniref:Uncharacterized protein n=1 Tax=Lolium multiflorum TaxID=4521 RepID=A0AAD8RK23_LOLMU|nr:hypothetical protein QYE76_000500 [Lolium multiflorum]
MENYSSSWETAAVMGMAVEMAAVDGEAFRGFRPGGVPDRDSCPPDLGFAMAAAGRFLVPWFFSQKEENKAHIGSQLENEHSLTLECDRLHRVLASEKEISFHLAQCVDMLKQQNAYWVELNNKSVTWMDTGSNLIKYLMEQKLKLKLKRQISRVLMRGQTAVLKAIIKEKEDLRAQLATYISASTKSVPE